MCRYVAALSGKLHTDDANMGKSEIVFEKELVRYAFCQINILSKLIFIVLFWSAMLLLLLLLTTTVAISYSYKYNTTYDVSRK